MSEGSAYLDYNATAPVKPAVAEAVARALRLVGNPSSVHRHGRLARRAVEEARDRVAALIAARPEQVVFTSGATEANNQALKGTAVRRLIVSAVEHDSVLAAAPQSGHDMAILPVDGDGVVDLDALDALLAEGEAPALVSVMLANNETGVIQPVAEVAARAHAAGAYAHCDAVQAPGRLDLDVDALGADMVSLSAHKLGGPKGVGALFVDDGVPLRSILQGGGQERGRRGGTENLPGIVGFGVAADLAREELSAVAEIARTRDSLEARLRAVAPGLTVHGAGAHRLPNTACLSMPGVAGETQVMALDLAGVAVSVGAACSSGKVRPSHVLRAMGVPEAEVGTAIRVSLGEGTTAGDIDRLVEAWSALYIRVASGHSAAHPAA